jgi:hypothetical protein
MQMMTRTGLFLARNRHDLVEGRLIPFPPAKSLASNIAGC